MKILLNSSGYFTGSYAIIGDLAGSIEVNSLPDCEEKYYTAYQYMNGEYVLDNEKKAEIDNILDNSESTIDRRMLALQEQIMVMDSTLESVLVDILPSLDTV